MKIRKVIVTFFLGIATISATIAPGNAQTESFAPRDIDFHWAEDHIETLINSGIMSGSNGYANPDANITRGEFCALTARTLGLKPLGDEAFNDIPKGHMFYDEISALKSHGIVSGTGSGNFEPTRKVTREEIMLIISRCIENNGEKNVSFKDIPKNYKYLTELKKALYSGVISGYEDKTFRPYNMATRAESASMLKRLIETFDSPSKTEADSLAKKFIQNDMKEVIQNQDLATGRAYEEISYKFKARERIKNADTEVTKLLSKLTLAEYNSNGGLTSLIYKGEIQYGVTSVRNSDLNTYDATFDVKIINKNNTLKVYDYTMSLGLKNKINLTWEVYSTVPDYAPKGINVVSPSSFQVSAENLGVESRPLFDGVKFYNSLTRKYMDYASSNGYMVWPIYKTDFTLKTADRFLNNKNARTDAVMNLIDYACEYGIEGINIDFENIYERNRYLVTKHSRELSVMLHELGMIVSADITRLEPTSANWSMCYNRDALAENCDYIMLMAYDEFYSSSKSAGPVASLDWVEDSIKKTLKEVPAHKLVLGIPFYMRYFEVTGTKVTSTKAISMQTAYELIQKNNPTYTYMESDGQYKISWKNGNKTCVFWLENSDTVKKRVELVNKYSLSGVASWRRGLEISKVWEVIEANL